jgi:hypothetical protein
VSGTVYLLSPALRRYPPPRPRSFRRRPTRQAVEWLPSAPSATRLAPARACGRWRRTTRGCVVQCLSVIVRPVLGMTAAWTHARVVPVLAGAGLRHPPSQASGSQVDDGRLFFGSFAGPDRSASAGCQPLRFSARNTCAASRRSRCWCGRLGGDQDRGPAAGQVPQAGAPARRPEEPGRGEIGHPRRRPHPAEDRL